MTLVFMVSYIAAGIGSAMWLGRRMRRYDAQKFPITGDEPPEVEELMWVLYCGLFWPACLPVGLLMTRVGTGYAWQRTRTGRAAIDVLFGRPRPR